MNCLLSTMTCRAGHITPCCLNTCHGLLLQGLNITNYLVGALDAITARELLRQDVHTFNMYEDGTELPAGELTCSRGRCDTGYGACSRGWHRHISSLQVC